MSKVFDWFQILLISIATVFCGTLVILLVPIGQRNSIRISSFLWSRMLLGICGVKLEIEGEENVDPNHTRIYISNHQSNIDIPVVFKAIPVPLFFIAKQELKKMPFLGWAMMAVGMIFIDRFHRDKAFASIRQAGKEIKRGKNVVSFPEGTRSRNGKIQMFKRGTFILAVENDIEVVPVALYGAEKIIPPGKFEIHPGVIKVAIGKPISPIPWKGKNEVEAFAKHCQHTIVEMRDQLEASA
ncbi:MAG: 1-acyl-sn-glycerol-3-phosphate acyltransferase [Crocinitomicaceae bacterium]|nr:1-acyl-sn-glycerol-3-phosphate acyltransferase [Crocinitomicaceae bacterium]|tara:strand:+ start:1808 stop:2530 length:723 start_codon:yes stop_codon:yes gene_type:complete